NSAPGSVCWASQKVGLFLGVTKRSAKSSRRATIEVTRRSRHNLAKGIAEALTLSGPFFRYSESGRWAGTRRLQEPAPACFAFAPVSFAIEDEAWSLAVRTRSSKK